MFTYLEFLINYKKSSLIPQTNCTFLGFVIDTVEFSLKLPSEKVCKLLSILRSFLNKKYCRIREFACLVGHLVSSCPAVAYGWMYTKRFEREKCIALILNNGNYEHRMTLSESLKEDFHWWISHLPHSYIIPLENFSSS